MARVGTADHGGLPPTFTIWPALREVRAPRVSRAIAALALLSGDIAVASVAPTILQPWQHWAGAAALAEPLPPLLVVPILCCLGLYASVGLRDFDRFRLRVVAVLIFATLAAVSSLRMQEHPRGATLLNLLPLAAFLVAAGHYVALMIRAALLRAGVWGTRTLVIGSDVESVEAVRTLLRHPDMGLKPIGIVTSDPHAAVHLDVPVPVLDVTTAKRAGAEAIVACRSSAALGAAESAWSWASSCRWFYFDAALRNRNSSASAHDFGDALLWDARWTCEAWLGSRVKRTVDVAVAAAALAATLPLLLLACMAVKIASPGPAFYTQERVGRNGAAFRVLKIRTMYIDADDRLRAHLAEDANAREEWQKFYKLRDDPRIIPFVGRLLRASSIDELPQLLNVIRGEMSLVGPRPFPKYHLQGFDADFLAVRQRITPGLTGMWQVSSRSDGDLDVQRSDDLFYIRNRSLLLDFYILVQTLPAVLSVGRAR